MQCRQFSIRKQRTWLFSQSLHSLYWNSYNSLSFDLSNYFSSAGVTFLKPRLGFWKECLISNYGTESFPAEHQSNPCVFPRLTFILLFVTEMINSHLAYYFTACSHRSRNYTIFSFSAVSDPWGDRTGRGDEQRLIRFHRRWVTANTSGGISTFTAKKQNKDIVENMQHLSDHVWV